MLRFVLLAFFMAGCAGTTTKQVAVTPQADTCQVTEVRPTAFSTLVLGICWDQKGNPIGMAGSGGQPGVSIPLAVLGAGATVSGAYILGSQLSGFTLEIQEGP